MTPLFVLTLTVIGVGATWITGNPWYAICGFFAIAGWVLAHTWGKYRP